MYEINMTKSIVKRQR